MIVVKIFFKKFFFLRFSIVFWGKCGKLVKNHKMLKGHKQYVHRNKEKKLQILNKEVSFKTWATFCLRKWIESISQRR